MMDSSPIRRRWRGLAYMAPLAAILLLGGCQRPTYVILESGDKALDRGRYEAAEVEYREVLERQPGEWRARRGLGEALLRQGQAEEARRHLDVAWALRPEDAETLDLLAEAQVESGEVAAMARQLRHVAEEQQGVEDWLRLGRFLAAAGDDDGAHGALLTAARLDKGRTVAPQLALADFYRGIGDDERSLRRYRMALWVDGDSTPARQGVRDHGEIPGPTYALRPTEAAQE